MAHQLEAMLMQSARLTVGIRRAYRRIKRDPGARYYTYVLLLQNNKMYVGSTDNIYNRLLDHCLMSASSAVWVREHGPVQRVVEVSRDCTRDDEAHKTLEYMSLFGWQNVRGAGYCRSAMRAAPACLADFRRDSCRRVNYLTRKEIDEIMLVVRDLAEHHDTASSAGDAGDAMEATTA